MSSVAAQQGSYLGRLLSRGYDFAEAVPTKTDGEASKSARAGMARPFQFLNLGILAYTGGNSALAQEQPDELKVQLDDLKVTDQAGAVQLDDVKVTDQAGAVGWLAWRSVYLAKQVSWKNQVSVLFDWAKTSLFGRDITRF
ncbi:hypothetical protein T484DRAFT_1786414 [Baffinella frigidus]|nr:hypothetical protein T484DRAFT_1786414 [Cryptophyta sp. CCMP2293]